jgi:hypothetical protein
MKLPGVSRGLQWDAEGTAEKGVDGVDPKYLTEREM